MIHFLALANEGLFLYYLVCNLLYLAMLIIALRGSVSHQQRLQSINWDSIKRSPLVPPITILTPAHNEEKSICVALHNFLSLDYPELEVIVINDGSTDRTFESIDKGFALREVQGVYVEQ